MAAQQQTKVAGGSRFAAACGLLRQYMMEQGGGRGAVPVGLMPGAQGVAAVAPEERTCKSKTMELFPQRAGTIRENSQQRILEPESAQLTIFYGGKTISFDDFPADKADELMQLASSFIAPATSDAEPDFRNVPVQHFLAGIPVARKVSLQRFLHKRKNRLVAAGPYPVPLVASARAAKETGKPVEAAGAPWLGFNSGLYLN